MVSEWGVCIKGEERLAENPLSEYERLILIQSG